MLTVTYSPQDLKYLANLNPRHRRSESLLLGFFEYVKHTWSPSAFRQLKEETQLKLTSNLNRCEFARQAAAAELQHLPLENGFSFSQQSELEFINLRERLEQAKQKAEQLELALQTEQKKLAASSTLNRLLVANRILPPGAPLNGTQDSAAMRVLGSPTTLTELEANYRELIKQEHPDVLAA